MDKDKQVTESLNRMGLAQLRTLDKSHSYVLKPEPHEHPSNSHKVNCVFGVNSRVAGNLSSDFPTMLCRIMISSFGNLSICPFHG